MSEITSTQPTHTILIAEDDAFLSRVLIDKLEKEKFTVIHATDGDDALKKMSENPVQLAILDIIMPKKTGFDVIDEMKKNPATATIPVIILSNLGQESDKQRAIEKGVVGYFVKSEISLVSVVEKIRASLGI